MTCVFALRANGALENAATGIMPIASQRLPASS